MPNRFDNNTVESRLARIENELELARVRDGRNTRHILKVMMMQHAEVMNALISQGALKHGVLQFSPPADKPSPAHQSRAGESGQAPSTPVPPTPQKPWAPADKPKEKTK